MASLMSERFGVPARTRDARALGYAAERAVDLVGGRTVWCASAMPRSHEAAQALSDCLRRPDAGGVSAATLELSLMVMHDPVTALLAGAVRERGAHAIWHLTVRRTPSSVSAWSFLRPYTHPLDAYVDQAHRPVGEGHVLRRTIAVMPSASVVTETDIEADGADTGHDVGWRSALAEVAETDRSEHVGGRLHPRPAVAVR
jgi:hypothetical protein